HRRAVDRAGRHHPMVGMHALHRLPASGGLPTQPDVTDFAGIGAAIHQYRTLGSDTGGGLAAVAGHRVQFDLLVLAQPGIVTVGGCRVTGARLLSAPVLDLLEFSMMRKPLAAALALGMSLAAAAQANEGMWMPTQLPELARTLKDAGFQGDPRQLADVTAPPLSAVVRVGGGTGAFVSGDGLLLTNHHVAYGVIQYNASKEL